MKNRYSSSEIIRLIKNLCTIGLNGIAHSIIFEENPKKMLHDLKENQAQFRMCMVDYFLAHPELDAKIIDEIMLHFSEYLNYLERYDILVCEGVDIINNQLGVGNKLIIYGIGIVGNLLYAYRNRLKNEIYCFCDRTGLASSIQSNHPLKAIRPSLLKQLDGKKDIVIATGLVNTQQSIIADLNEMNINGNYIKLLV